MNREQAKEILLTYRQGSDDTAHPEIAEALQLLDQDPELARWFEAQQRVDETIRTALRLTLPGQAPIDPMTAEEQPGFDPSFGTRCLEPARAPLRLL